jgi:putative membrane protein
MRAVAAGHAGQKAPGREVASVLGVVLRFVVAALVLLLLGHVLPGFHISGFWPALLAALVIAALGWVVEAVFGRHASPYGHGLVGFIASAVVIYGAQVLVPAMHVSILGALLAALVIGIVDVFVPTEVR